MAMNTPIVKPKQLILLVLDMIAISASFLMAYFFRYGAGTFRFVGERFVTGMLIATPIFIAYYIAFSYYNAMWKHAGFREYMFGIFANILAGITFLMVMIFHRMIFLPLVVLGTILTLVSTMGLRLIGRTLIYAKAWLDLKLKGNQRVMVIGAGDAAAIAISDMKRNSFKKLNPVCAIDDNKRNKGTYISGIPVVGGIDCIVRKCEELKIDTILIAIPSLSEERRSEIIGICRETKCTVKTMNKLFEEFII